MLPYRMRQICNCLPPEVKLLAVSKGHSASSIRTLVDLGQCDFGESRLQEALLKINDLKDIKNLRWHFIGHLQMNKVRKVVQTFDFIHSVDSTSLAERLSRISGEEKRHLKVMLQVKFHEDPTKSGFAPELLVEDWPKLIALPHLKIVGLMTMAPIGLDLDARKKIFLNCRLLANQLNLPDCSMGMSSDWKEALQSGATWLRLGSTLFGNRSNHVNSHTDITKSD